MEHQPDKIFKITAWIFLLLMLVIILKNLAFIFIPFSLSLLICYALGIPLDLLKRYKLPQFLRILLVILFLSAFGYLFSRLISTNFQEFYSQLPQFEEKFWGYVKNIMVWLDISQEQIKESYDTFIGSLGGEDFKSLGFVARQMGSSFFSFLGNMIWVILFIIFILAEKDDIDQKIIKAFGRRGAEPLLEAGQRINKAVQDYLGLKTLISLGTGLLVFLALYLFTTPFALLWGVLAFCLNFIPNIGSLIAVVPPVAITLFQYGSLPRTLGVCVVLIVIQMVVGNFVEPKVMGKGLNLSPIAVLFALLFWGWMWGMPGMLLSVPLTAAIKIAFEQVEATRPIALLMAGK